MVWAFLVSFVCVRSVYARTLNSRWQSPPRSHGISSTTIVTLARTLEGSCRSTKYPSLLRHMPAGTSDSESTSRCFPQYPESPHIAKPSLCRFSFRVFHASMLWPPHLGQFGYSTSLLPSSPCLSTNHRALMKKGTRLGVPFPSPVSPI